MQVTTALADLILGTINTSLLNDSGNPTIDVMADDGGNPGDVLATFELDSTAPFDTPEDGATGFRKVVLTTGGDEDFDVVGLAAAGAGTDAAHYALKAQDGTVRGRGLVRGTGDADTGQELVLSNKNIAEAQAVTLVTFDINKADAAAE
jgi:hypothetical protein